MRLVYDTVGYANEHTLAIRLCRRHDINSCRENLAAHTSSLTKILKHELRNLSLLGGRNVPSVM